MFDTDLALDLTAETDTFSNKFKGAEAEAVLRAREVNGKQNLILSYTDLEAIFNSDCLEEMENPNQIRMALAQLLRGS